VKTKKYIFIGYSQLREYKLFDPITKLTFINKDVDFIENMTLDQKEDFGKNIFRD